MILVLGTSVILIVLNGVFVAYEFALLASKKEAFSADAADGSRAAKSATQAMSDLSMQMAGAQLGITMTSISLGHVAKPPLESLFGPLLERVGSEDLRSALGYGLAISVVGLVQLVLGEMVPKNMALANPEKATRALVLPYQAYLAMVRPLVRVLKAAAVAGSRVLGIEPADEIRSAHSAAELAEIVSESSEGGAIDLDRAEMLRLAIEFAEVPVLSVTKMVDDVAHIRMGATGAQIETVAAVSGHTRIPVSTRSPSGDIGFVGYVHAKDLLKLDQGLRSSPVPDSFIRPMLVVDQQRPLIEVLRIMRSAKRHVAVVNDSDSNPLGITTIEDVVSALAEVSRAESV